MTEEITETILTSDNVMKTFFNSLYNDEEVARLKPETAPEGAILIEGITIKVGFHPERLKNNKLAIRSMLSQLPPTFQHDKGGGHSFLEACNTSNGILWGDHRSMELLFILGMASNMVKLCAPREMWKSLPGGVPYYVINLGGFQPS
jgi:hypothetical protein